MSWVQATLGGVCRAKKGGLALHFGVESADDVDIKPNPKTVADWYLKLQQKRVVTPGKIKNTTLLISFLLTTSKPLQPGRVP